MKFIEGAFEYRIDGNKCILTKLIHPDYYLEIPDCVRGKPVREIGAKAFYNIRDVGHVVLPYTLSHIKEEAFACSNISVIKRRKNKNAPTLYIGKLAFHKCCCLTTVELSGQTFLEDSGYQFQECLNLQRIDSLSICGSIPIGAFKSCDIRLFCFNHGTYIASEAFAGTVLEKIYVQGNLKYASDFLIHRDNIEIVCEKKSPIANLAYEGYNVKIKQ